MFGCCYCVIRCHYRKNHDEEAMDQIKITGERLVTLSGFKLTRR